MLYLENQSMEKEIHKVKTICNLKHFMIVEL